MSAGGFMIKTPLYYYSYYMGVSENGGTPKSSILIRFSIINHPFWGTPILETPIYSLPKPCNSG